VWAEPQITDVSPKKVWATADNVLTITGSGFLPGSTVTLSHPKGGPAVQGTDVAFVSSREFRATFDLSTGQAGWWNMLIVQADLSNTLQLSALAVRATPTIERIAAWGGPVQAMEIRERVLDDRTRQLGYVARGSGMVILDVTDPSNMVELSNLDLESNGVYDIAVQGDYAYVCGESIEVAVVDVSDPANPHLVARDLGESLHGAPTEITFSGSAAYIKFGGVGGGPGVFYTLDISDPGSMASNASFVRWPRMVYTATATASYLYVVVDRSDLDFPDEIQLYLYDLSDDELAPVLLGTTPLLVSTDFEVTALSVDGDFAYVSMFTFAPSSRVAIVNVADPTNPFLNGVFTDLFRAKDVAVSGGIAYVADHEVRRSPPRRTAKGLVTVDMNDPFNPVALGELTTHGSVAGVTVAGTTVYLFDRGEGIISVDVSDPANPRRLGNWHSPAFIQSIDSEGDTLFFSDWWNGITALDVSDPRAPQLLSAYQTNTAPGWSGENGPMSMQNGFAYLAAGYNWLEVVDFRDPANPILAGGFQLEPPVPTYGVPRATGLVVKENVLVLAGVDGSGVGEGMWTFDISDPGDPILGSFDPLCAFHHAWAITDDFLAVGVMKFSGWPGVMWDVSDPFNPVVLAGNCPDRLELRGMGVFVEGNRIYVVNDEFDVKGRFSIHEIDRSGEGVNVSPVAAMNFAEPSGVAVREGIAYVTGSPQRGTTPGGSPLYGPYGLLVIDTNVVPPHIIASIATLAEFVHLDWPYVYTGTEKRSYVGSGLGVFRATSPGSVDIDGDADLLDFAHFQNCFGRAPGPGFNRDCTPLDFDGDGHVDGSDLGAWERGMTGPM
jgi:hypothetical protein